jgi:hypothetical protein
VCPLPAQRTTTISRSAIKGPILWNSRSGKASRKFVMKRRKAKRPRWKVCIEYCRSTSGAASSSTIARSGRLPQNEANHRPTIALFNASLSMKSPLCHHAFGLRSDDAVRQQRGALRFLRWYDTKAMERVRDGVDRRVSSTDHGQFTGRAISTAMSNSRGPVRVWIAQPVPGRTRQRIPR